MNVGPVNLSPYPRVQPVTAVRAPAPTQPAGSAQSLAAAATAAVSSAAAIRHRESFKGRLIDVRA